MFDLCQKSTGITYTTTVALIVVAFVFSPAVLIMSRPVGYLSVWLAIGCSALCVAMACVTWRKFSRLSIPSIATQDR